jgi:hypothetical protein
MAALAAMSPSQRRWSAKLSAPALGRRAGTFMPAEFSGLLDRDSIHFL